MVTLLVPAFPLARYLLEDLIRVLGMTWVLDLEVITMLGLLPYHLRDMHQVSLIQASLNARRDRKKEKC